MTEESEPKATDAVVKVGEGRGFVIEGGIVTAAHCLPFFPPAASIATSNERTYANLIGEIRGKTDVWVECLFVDPVADIAVLGSPDNQSLYDEAEAFETFVESRHQLTVADIPPGDVEVDGWMLDLSSRWVRCRVGSAGHSLWSLDYRTVAGMSGSPILNTSHQAVGVVVAGSSSDHDGPHPRLADDLPGWLCKVLCG